MGLRWAKAIRVLVPAGEGRPAWESNVPENVTPRNWGSQSPCEGGRANVLSTTLNLPVPSVYGVPLIGVFG